MTKMLAAEKLVQKLVTWGVTSATEYPGDTTISLVEALERTPQIHTLRNQSDIAAGLSIFALGKATSTPAVAIGSRSAGGLPLVPAINVLAESATPGLFIISEGEINTFGHDMQTAGYEQIFAAKGMAKAVYRVRHPDDIANVTAEALARSTQGRPGPVVMLVSKKILESKIDAELPIPPHRPRSSVMPDTYNIQRASKSITQATKPVMVVGEMSTFEQSKHYKELIALAERYSIPVVTDGRNTHGFPNNHPLYVGSVDGEAPHAIEAIAESDCLIMMGSRWTPKLTGDGKKLDLLRSKKVVHIHPEPDILHVIDCGAVTVQSDIAPAISSLSSLMDPSLVPQKRLEWADILSRKQEAFVAQPHAAIEGYIGAKNIASIVSKTLADDKITYFSNDCGWSTRYFNLAMPFDDTRILASPASGVMGTGLPGAIALSCLFEQAAAEQAQGPQPRVIAVLGDGAALMSLSEIQTAINKNLDITVIIADNQSLEQITHSLTKLNRLKQASNIQESCSKMDLENKVDFASLARSFGANAYCVTTEHELVEALKHAATEKGTHVIHALTHTEFPEMLADSAKEQQKLSLQQTAAATV